jgi:signal transduction histidine kinase
MGGTIEIDSEVNIGTTFTLTFKTNTNVRYNFMHR